MRKCSYFLVLLQTNYIQNQKSKQEQKSHSQKRKTHLLNRITLS